MASKNYKVKMTYYEGSLSEEKCHREYLVRARTEYDASCKARELLKCDTNFATQVEATIMVIK